MPVILYAAAENIGWQKPREIFEAVHEADKNAVMIVTLHPRGSQRSMKKGMRNLMKEAGVRGVVIGYDERL